MLYKKIDIRTTEALLMLHGRINEDIPYVIGGSMSLLLQGLDVKPKDADILTTWHGACQIHALMSEFESEKLIYSSNGQFRSLFGALDIRGLKLDIIGDLEANINGEWKSYNHRLKNPPRIDFLGHQIPVSPLHEQLESYNGLKRDKDTEKIEKLKKYFNIY